LVLLGWNIKVVVLLKKDFLNLLEKVGSND
jgi:hypothetical protein